MKMFYKSPAKRWVEALPLGNGRIGAMVYGDVAADRICLNEDTLWSGYPQEHNLTGRHKFITQAAELSKQGKYHEAEAVIQQNVMGDYTQAYMPFGDIIIRTAQSEITDYSRELCLNNAIVGCDYKADGTSYKRQSFASYQDNVFVYKITADKAASISCEISFESPIRHTVTTNGNELHIEGVCPSHAEPSYLNMPEPTIYHEDKERTGIRFHGVLRVVAVSADVTASKDSLSIKNADDVTIYFGARSNFAGYDKHPEFAGNPYIEPAIQDVDAAESIGFDKLLNRHIEDYTSLYNRVEFTLGEDEEALVPMDIRLENFNKSLPDRYLPVYLFQFGRYLMISSSRAGTQATNLQGIWSNLINPPWSSNYTININTQMNYWCTFMANLAECHEPLVELIKKTSVNGAKTAKEYYGARGFVSHHNTDIWGLTNPVGKDRDGTVRHSFWPMSSGWLCEHLFEQYEYTQDRDFLRHTAYPIIKLSAEFHLDTLDIDSNGYYAMMPSTSPENAFILDGKVCAVSKTSTMTMAIIREVFENCIKCCNILNVDEDFSTELKEILAKLYPFEVGSDGRLLEWSEEYEEEDPEHRHISHLYPLHPARLIIPKRDERLAKACRKVLDVKGLTGTGWSLGWKVNMWARLLDGENALKLIKQQLTLVNTPDGEVVMKGGGSYPNLFDAHPPFQIDGNFGVTSGIAEMLLQSYDDEILLLPALPDEWQNGEIKGLRAKNNVTVDIKWQGGVLTEAKLVFGTPTKVTVCYGEEARQAGEGTYIFKP